MCVGGPPKPIAPILSHSRAMLPRPTRVGAVREGVRPHAARISAQPFAAPPALPACARGLNLAPGLRRVNPSPAGEDEEGEEGGREAALFKQSYCAVSVLDESVAFEVVLS